MIIRTLSGVVVPLRVSIYESVHDAKMKIQEEMGVPVEQQRLVHSGRTLVDTNDLEMYRIDYGDTIYLVLISGGKE